MTGALSRWLLAAAVVTLVDCSPERPTSRAETTDAGVAASHVCLGEGTSSIGGPCPCPNDCEAYLICVPETADGWPQGQCVARCRNGADCPSTDWYCAKSLSTDAEGTCSRTCQRSDDCGDDRGWCIEGECFLACSNDAQCLSGHCDLGTHTCTDGKPRPGAPLQGACLRDRDCAVGDCGRSSLHCSSSCLPDRQACPPNSDCILAQTLFSGSCLLRCKSNSDCPPNWRCEKDSESDEYSHCFTLDPPQTCTGVTSRTGEPCGCDGDCAGGLPCMPAPSSRNIVPGGLCLRQCDAHGDGSGTECPSGEKCHFHANVDSGDRGACVQACARPSDCAEGRVCSLKDGCVPYCQSDAECASTGKPCNRYLGFCTGVELPGPSMPIGAACESEDDCAGAFCVSGDGDHWFCSARCSIARQGCPDGATCVDYRDGDRGVCVPKCNLTLECPPGTACSAHVCSPK
jgi:hypothetical protein